MLSFFRKHGYSEGTHGGLRLESVTPMVLIRSFYIMIVDFLCQNLWQIAPKKRNTYGVVSRKPYVNPG